MRNGAVFGVILLIGLAAVLLGVTGTDAPEGMTSVIPHIGSVQVLNGCGIDGAAQETAQRLRMSGFDVKEIGNAPSWNYPHTIVVARSGDPANAERVARAISTERVVVIRNEQSLVDIDVIVGHDFAPRTGEHTP